MLRIELFTNGIFCYKPRMFDWLCLAICGRNSRKKTFERNLKNYAFRLVLFIFANEAATTRYELKKKEKSAFSLPSNHGVAISPSVRIVPSVVRSTSANHSPNGLTNRAYHILGITFKHESCHKIVVGHFLPHV